MSKDEEFQHLSTVYSKRDEILSAFTFHVLRLQIEPQYNEEELEDIRD